MARARPKVVTLTDAAAERVKSIMGRSETPVLGLRVGVKKGGCAGMEYTMDYATEVRPIDEVVEDKGVRILIEPSAILFLLGTEMDWKADKLTSASSSKTRTKPALADAVRASKSNLRKRFDRSFAASY